ncbi:hypothetical protein J2805_004300 [Arthrobacter oryzae]|nr:hypothetical protein [Arthrobacter oryzae]
MNGIDGPLANTPATQVVASSASCRPSLIWDDIRYAHKADGPDQDLKPSSRTIWSVPES